MVVSVVMVPHATGLFRGTLVLRRGIEEGEPGVNVDGYLKNPTSALHFIPRHELATDPQPSQAADQIVKAKAQGKGFLRM
jgi:hypothetical protein